MLIVDYERFCESHPYRVVENSALPERRFATLFCAARTVCSEGPNFMVRCGDFIARYDECRKLVNAAEMDRQIERGRNKSGYWKMEAKR